MSVRDPAAVIVHAYAVADDVDLDLTNVIVFGSVARGDATDDSDVDLILVSPDFEGTEFHERAVEFDWEWDREYGTPDITPVTPDEFTERRNADNDVIATAVEEGVSANRLSADEVPDAVTDAGKRAGLGAGTRERLQRMVRGYQRVDAETVTPDSLRRDLRFDGFPDELVDAVVVNTFCDAARHVYPPYEQVKGGAEAVRIGDEVWQADRESWPATRWTTRNGEEVNTTHLHDEIRREIREGTRVVVEGADGTLFERAAPIQE